MEKKSHVKCKGIITTNYKECKCNRLLTEYKGNKLELGNYCFTHDCSLFGIKQ